MKNANVWVALFTGVLAAVSIYQGFVLRRQLIELTRVDDATIEAQSPFVHSYGFSLVHDLPDHPPHNPIPSSDKIELLNNRSNNIDACVAVEFENFGNRAATVYGVDIESIVLPVNKLLAARPFYNHDREQGAAIRPSGAPPVPEPFVDDHQILHLSRSEVADIVSGQKRLWVYGVLHLNKFPNQFEEYRFCSVWEERTDREGFSERDCPPAYLGRNTLKDQPLVTDWFNDPTRHAEDKHCPSKSK